RRNAGRPCGCAGEAQPGQYRGRRTFMKLSEGRILTTHAGSLPRPKALTELYARRAHGQPVEQAKLDAAAREATKWVVAKQRETGIDVANNGEQAREGFFLYVQHRMSGFGGRWTRPPWRDLVSYPRSEE